MKDKGISRNAFMWTVVILLAVILLVVAGVISFNG